MTKDKDIGKKFETPDLEKPPRGNGVQYDAGDPDLKADVGANDPDLKNGSDQWLASELLKIAKALISMKQY